MGKDLNGKELGIGIRQRKNGSYTARYTDAFGRRHEICSKNLRDLKNQFVAAKYKSQMYAQVDSINSNYTVNEVYSIWIERYELFVKPSTINIRKLAYHTYIKPVIGDKQIKRVHEEDIYVILKSLQDKALESVKSVKVTLNLLFAYAEERSYILKAGNPLKNVKIPNNAYKASKRRSVLSEAQQKAFLANFAEIRPRYKYAYNIALFTLYTGMRIGEIAALRWKHINLEKRLISIEDNFVNIGAQSLTTTPKTKSSKRIIPICDTVYELLTKIKPKSCDSNALVFYGRDGEHLRRTALNRIYRKVIEKVNEKEIELAAQEDRQPDLLPIITNHSLRHTFATRCFEKGISAKVVQQLLGHASISITMDTYTHVSNELLLSNIKILDNI